MDSVVSSKPSSFGYRLMFIPEPGWRTERALMPPTAWRAGEDAGRVLELSGLDLEEIASALSDQTDYEHRWLINPETGQVAYWTCDTGIDARSSGSPATHLTATTRPRVTS